MFVGEELGCFHCLHSCVSLALSRSTRPTWGSVDRGRGWDGAMTRCGREYAATVMRTLAFMA